MAQNLLDSRNPTSEVRKAASRGQRGKRSVRGIVSIEIFLDPFRIEAVDDRSDYPETRFQTIGRVGQRILVVIYTEREGGIRIISARRATKNERKSYEEN